MKTEITLMTSPQIFYSRFPIAGRILYNNLMNDSRFHVHLTEKTQLECYSHAYKAWIDICGDDEIFRAKGTGKYDIYAKEYMTVKYGKMEWNCRFSIFYLSTGALDHVILKNTKTEIVFYTSYSILDIRLVKTLLNDKRKVMLGGSATMIYPPDEIRHYLVEMGVDRKLVDENLIIVSGYVDLTTDLYKLVEKWEDSVITENDFTTFWDCTKDGFLDYIRIYRDLFDTHLSSVMTSKCWWGKCTYCTYVCLPKVDFTDGVSVERMVEYYNALRENYESNNIFFSDSYVVNTDFNRRLFKRLSDEGFLISFYSGVQLLSNRKFLEEFVNEINLNRICVGLESVDDFALSSIKKGYNREDIKNWVTTMGKYIKNPESITLFNFLMVDLPRNSANKQQALDDIKDDWDFLIDLKKQTVDTGLHAEFSVCPVRHFPKTNLMDDKLLKPAREDQMGYETLSGMFGLYDYYNRHYGINIDEIKDNLCINEPYVRYLPNGDLLESDMHYVDSDIMLKLMEWE